MIFGKDYINYTQPWLTFWLRWLLRLRIIRPYYCQHECESLIAKAVNWRGNIYLLDFIEKEPSK